MGNKVSIDAEKRRFMDNFQTDWISSRETVCRTRTPSVRTAEIGNPPIFREEPKTNGNPRNGHLGLKSQFEIPA